MKIIRKIIYLIFLLSIVFALIAIGYYITVTKGVELDPQKLILNEKSIAVYDYQGEIVKNTAVVSSKQTVTIENIPQHLKAAFLDTEDKRFYAHNGFDWKRITKATLNNIRTKSFKEGASTISQQLIKNTHLSQEKTFKRKLREWKLTHQLENKFSKDEILEKYLNTIYFGHNCFGIKAAAEFYFEKNVENLNVSECAILAGLVKSPNNYSPFKNPERCLTRRNCVLKLMYVNKSIPKNEYENALNTPLPLISEHFNHNFGYLNFVFDELSTLAEKNNFKVGGNIEIYTYLEPELQTELETITQQITDSDKNIMVLDNQTHGFKACVSSIGNIKRLPGSLIKPLLVYGPAIEENIISPATPILDEKIDYNGYAPENYDKIFHGYVSARECVAKSLNIPAVKILSSLGIEKGAEYLNMLELPIETDDKSLALALGGMKNGFTFRSLMDAYSTFPNNGNFHRGSFISKIKINNDVVYQAEHIHRQVFSPESAFLMTDILRTTTKTGTAKKLRTLNFDIAAKTGTVGNENGNTDAYAIAYTTKDTVGVWLGNKNNSYISQTGGGLPCNLLLNIHEYLYKNYQNIHQTIDSFKQPQNVLSLSLDKQAYYDTHTIMHADNLAPIEYTFYELFKYDNQPLQKSLIFSNPTISTPAIRLENNQLIIQFNNTPSYYQYKIDKYDYVRHSTVYFGDYTKTFIDNHLENNKSYIYTVTPVYNGNYGKPVTLPAITTKGGNFDILDSNILKEDWWKY
ncbi:MAG: penicillin-binding protein [Clostridiales bacterium]|nr:penicillin-binding protein [Clostridiales bacterium]